MKNQDDKIEDLKKKISGDVILADEAGYDEARAIWNGMFDKKPALIVRCSKEEDVVAAVNYGREEELMVAVKGGGHNSAGTASCDDGIMIDLSPLNKVEVDPERKIIKAQGGCLLSAIDEKAHQHGLTVSSGIISHTGVGGLTLGGGFGWISRKFGFSIDNLLSAKVVTADGRIVKASETENPDLFWGLRGGGGNFGIVTEFEFRASAVGKEVFSGPIVKNIDNLEECMIFYRDYVRQMPDEMSVWMVIRNAPPLPFLDEKYHGKPVLIFPFVWLGDKAEGEKLIQPLKDIGQTLGDGSAMHPWPAWQSAFDGLVTHGARNYWKSHHLKGLPDDCIKIISEFASKMPSNECEIFIPHMEGVPSRIAPEATAFPHRNTPFVMNIHTRWRDAADDERCIAWARAFHDATRPYSKGVYVNFLSDEGKDRVKEAYTPETWEKLVQIKNTWDPGNLFCLNQNIAPYEHRHEG